MMKRVFILAIISISCTAVNGGGYAILSKAKRTGEGEIVKPDANGDVQTQPDQFKREKRPENENKGDETASSTQDAANGVVNSIRISATAIVAEPMNMNDNTADDVAKKGISTDTKKPIAEKVESKEKPAEEKEYHNPLDDVSFDFVKDVFVNTVNAIAGEFLPDAALVLPSVGTNATGDKSKEEETGDSVNSKHRGESHDEVAKEAESAYVDSGHQKEENQGPEEARDGATQDEDDNVEKKTPSEKAEQTKQVAMDDGPKWAMDDVQARQEEEEEQEVRLARIREATAQVQVDHEALEYELYKVRVYQLQTRSITLITVALVSILMLVMVAGLVVYVKKGKTRDFEYKLHREA